MAPFRVIIVGGSISGLALANMLEQYGIDYILLEKYAVIAPQVGAGFAIQPNGARILDQLGCYQPLHDENEPVNYLSSIDQDQNQLKARPEFGLWFEQLFGYKMRFMDRRKVIETLYENLRDKSKILTSHGAVKISYDSDGASVEVNDGSVFHGDLAVGADGVHSCVRREMQRIAAEETPGFDMFPEENSFTCEYRGLFGISKAPDGLTQDESFKCFIEGRSYLCAPGPRDTLYWIVFFKNEEKTRGKQIPRYTEKDQEDLVTLAQDDVVRPGLTFREIYDKRIRATTVPIEEGILKHSFYKRMVLLGDSWHKVNPICGFGGNTAIQCAATLANELKDVIAGTGNTDLPHLQKALQNYENSRKSASRSVVVTGRKIQKMEALETPVAKFFQLKLMAYFSIEMMSNGLCQWFAATPRLKHLPLPSSSRRGLMPFNDEVTVKPKRRSGIITMLFISILAAMVFFMYIFAQQGKQILTTEETLMPPTKLRMGLDETRFAQFYYNIAITAIPVLISVESYRLCFSMGPMGIALPFGIASIFVGWEFVAPVYFALFVYFTGTKSYYYPSPRAIDLATARALLIAYLVNYLPCVIYTFTCSTFPSFSWAISHATLPLTIQLFAKWIARRSTVSLRGPAFVAGDRDLKPLSDMFDSLKTILSLVWFSANYQSILKSVSLRNFVFTEHSYSPDEIKHVMLGWTTLAFVMFMIWDIRRVNIRDGSLFTMVLITLGMGVGTHPSMALVHLWASRETKWEESRQRQKSVEDNSEKA